MGYILRLYWGYIGVIEGFDREYRVYVGQLQTPKGLPVMKQAYIFGPFQGHVFFVFRDFGSPCPRPDLKP